MREIKLTKKEKEIIKKTKQDCIKASYISSIVKKYSKPKMYKKPNYYKLAFKILFISLAILGTLFILGKVAYLITLHKANKDWQEIYVPTDITHLTENVTKNNVIETKPIEKVTTTKENYQVITRSDEVRTSETYKITAYCPCIQCCGKTDGITASGVKATPNHTIATSSKFAFGTKIEIDGIVYTVEDRGGAIQGNRIDVYCRDTSGGSKLWGTISYNKGGGVMIKEIIVKTLLKQKGIKKELIKDYNNYSNEYNGHKDFEEYLIHCYTYYRDNQSGNDYLFQKYQTYREVMEHYNQLLKDKLDVGQKLQEIN